LLRFLIDALARAHPECLALPAELDIVKVRGPLAGLGNNAPCAGWVLCSGLLSHAVSVFAATAQC
jgi:hypothetical protein